jgi:hypothetical protein
VRSTTVAEISPKENPKKDPLAIKVRKFKIPSNHMVLCANYFVDNEKKIFGVTSGDCQFQEAQEAIENFVKFFHNNLTRMEVKNAFQKSFKEVDEKFSERVESGGLSLVVAFFDYPDLHLAWVGSNFAYGISDDQQWTDLITNTHSTSNEIELERLMLAHQKNPNFLLSDVAGKVPRIDDRYTHTRSIGNKQYQGVIDYKPDYIKYDLTGTNFYKFLLVSDKLKMSQELMQQNHETEQTSKKFCNHLLKSHKNKNREDLKDFSNQTKEQNKKRGKGGKGGRGKKVKKSAEQKKTEQIPFAGLMLTIKK